MITWQIKNYKTKDGNEPAEEWLRALSDKTLRSALRSKITSLSENGLLLLKTKAMTPIKGNDDDLYELKAGDGRITVYFDRQKQTFILLNAFRKTKKNQKDKIKEARRYLHDYLDREGS